MPGTRPPCRSRRLRSRFGPRSHAREEPTQNATEESARQNSRICVREHKKRNKSILYRMQQFLLEYKYRRRNINIPHVPPDGMAEAMSK